MVARNAKRIMMTLGDSKFTKVVFSEIRARIFYVRMFLGSNTWNAPAFYVRNIVQCSLIEGNRYISFYNVLVMFLLELKFLQFF